MAHLMRRNPLKDAHLAIGLAALVAAAAVGIDVLQDPDVWWHLRTGQFILNTTSIPHADMYTYTAAGNAQTLASWLAEVIYALIFQFGGLLAMALFMAAVAWGGFVALTKLARLRGVSWIAIAVALVIMARTAEPVLGTRTQVWSFAFTCCALYVVERSLRDGGRWPWLLPPMFLVWANLHGGFAVTWFLLAIVCVVEAVSQRRKLSEISTDHLRTLTLALGVAALAACINPFGPYIWVFAVAGGSGEFNKPITEWQSPNFHDSAMLPLLVVIALLVILPAFSKRLTLRDVVLNATGIVLALLAIRNTQILIAVATPTMALLLEDAWNKLVPSGRSLISASRTSIGVLALASAVAVLGVRISLAVQDSSASGVAARYPSCSAQRLLSAPPGTRLFAPYGDGGYFIDQLWPRTHVYIYGESISLGLTVFNNYLRISDGATDQPSALSLLSAGNTTAVLAGDKSSLGLELAASPQWKSTNVVDLGLRLYVASSSTWADALAPC